MLRTPPGMASARSPTWAAMPADAAQDAIDPVQDLGDEAKDKIKGSF